MRKNQKSIASLASAMQKSAHGNFARGLVNERHCFGDSHDEVAPTFRLLAEKEN
jgi:hypothetical protein